MRRQNTFLSIITLALVCASGAIADNWIRDAASGCAIWNPNPSEHETIVWQGISEDGKASGYGIATWRVKGKQTEQAKGEWLEGRLDGHAVWTHVSGARYEGEWKDGGKHGCGVYTWPDGTTFLGSYMQNTRSIGRVFLPDGSPRKAVASSATRDIGYRAEDAAILARKAATRAEIENPTPPKTAKRAPGEKAPKKRKPRKKKAPTPAPDEAAPKTQQPKACSKPATPEEDPSAK